MREETFDVVVVGGGGAGLAAAIEARNLGRNVVLLEKNDKLGGSTAWSIGSISATNTPHQLRAGIKDCPHDHWRDMAAFNGDLDSRDNPALRRILTDEMPETFRWLLNHGIRFFGPMPEPPHKKPRMHNILPNSRSYIVNLERAARRAGVVIRQNTRLIAIESSSARGAHAICDTATGRTCYQARGGVILTTGDFTNDPELKAQFMGPQESKVDGVNPTATGDGQRIAVKLGAHILNGDLALGPELRFVPPQKSNILLKLPPWSALAAFLAWAMNHLPGTILRPFIMSFVTTALAPSPSLFTQGALLVNKRGERFTDETGKPAYVTPDQPDKVAYILLDQRVAKLFDAWPNYVSTAPGVAYAYIADYRRNRRDIFSAAPNLEGLAAKLGMRTGSLISTVENYNTTAGNRPQFESGPVTALGPVRSVFVHAEGGLAVDQDHRVLGAGNQVIPGLYAAGATGQGGLLLKGHGHHLAWAFASGRRAGRRAALAAVSQDIVA